MEQSNSINQHHQNGQYYTMSGGVTSYMSSPAPSVVAKVPECSDLETRIALSGDFGIDNNGSMMLGSNTNTHIDYYERSLYDEFTLKNQQQQQINHQRALSMDGTSQSGGNNSSSHPRFSSSSVSSNVYTNNGNAGYRNYSHQNSLASPPNLNNFHQLQTPSFHGQLQHQTAQSISNRHFKTEQGLTINNSSASNRTSDLGDEVGSLAALDGLTDLLPMMPTSEAVKLSLREIEGLGDESNDENATENKPMINNNSLVLIGSSPTSPSSTSQNGSTTLKNWDESGSVASSHSSSFSSSETPPPLHPSTSLYHLQPLKPLYQQQETMTKFTGYSYLSIFA